MPESTQPIRVAVVGAGSFGRVHLRAYRQLAMEGRVVCVGVADRSPEARERCEREFGLRTYADHLQMLERERPEAVSVATPDDAHRAPVLDALAAGCHVLVEKPMDTSVAGCEAMAAAARERGLILEVDFHKRFDPYHKSLHDAVAQGRLGTPLYGYAWMEDRIEYPRDHLRAWAERSSPVWFLGTHMIDLFRWVIGGPAAVSVHAAGQAVRLRELGIETYDAIQAQIAFEGGATFSLDTSWILPDGFEAVVNQGLRLVGTEGLAEIDSQDRGAAVCTTGAGQQTWNLGFRLDDTDKWGRPRHRGYGYEAIADLVDNIEFLRGGGTLEALGGQYPSGEDGLEVTRIAAAIHQSLARREKVALR